MNSLKHSDCVYIVYSNLTIWMFFLIYRRDDSGHCSKTLTYSFLKDASYIIPYMIWVFGYIGRKQACSLYDHILLGTNNHYSVTRVSVYLSLLEGVDVKIILYNFAVSSGSLKPISIVTQSKDFKEIKTQCIFSLELDLWNLEGSKVGLMLWF